MNEELNYIDKLVQESLTDLQLPVSEKELAKINRSLSVKRFLKFNFSRFNIYYASLIVILIITVLSVCLHFNKTSISPASVKKKAVTISTNKEDNLLDQKRNPSALQKERNETVINHPVSHYDCNIPGTVLSSVRIDNSNGGFKGKLHVGDLFGFSVASIGDINGDGIKDIAVGAPWDNDGGKYRGAVWILFLKSDGTVKNQQKISSLQGGFNGHLDDYDAIGSNIASLGDFNKDGIPDIVVQALGDDDGNKGSGALWILFLNHNGTVNRYQKISSTEGGLNIMLESKSFFGQGIDNLGDIDDDGVIDLIVGMPGYDDAKSKNQTYGSIIILYMNPDGTVKASQKIDHKNGGFTGKTTLGDLFGYTVSSIGDINNDGVTDIAVGAPWDNCGGIRKGAEWILMLNKNGAVKEFKKICSKSKELNPYLDDYDVFGTRSCKIGDIDGDNINDLIIGAYGDDDGENHAGAIYINCLQPDGKLKSVQKISATQGGFNDILKKADMFGRGLSCLGDFDNDGNIEVVCGAPGFDDATIPSKVTGSVWILKLCTKSFDQLTFSSKKN